MPSTTSDIAPTALTAAIPRWATYMFTIAAALQAIEGASALPSVPGVVLAGLSAAAIFFLFTGRTRYALLAMAAALFATWLQMVASAQPEASPTDWLLLVLPVIAATVSVLAWRNTRLTLAALLASLPTLASIALAFLLGLAVG